MSKYQCPDPECDFTWDDDGKVQTFGDVIEHADVGHGPEIRMKRFETGWKLIWDDD